MANFLKEIDAHDALFLLQKFFSMPRLTYLLQTSSRFLKNEILKKYESIIKDSLQDILIVKLEEKVCDQSALPIKLDGLEIKLATKVSLPAYLSSVYSSNSIVKSLVPNSIKDDPNLFYEQGYYEWKLLAEAQDIPKNPCFQSELGVPIFNKLYRNLITLVPSRKEKAWLWLCHLKMLLISCIPYQYLSWI